MVFLEVDLLELAVVDSVELSVADLLELRVAFDDLLNSPSKPAVNLYFCELLPSFDENEIEAPAEGEIFFKFQLFLS